MTLFHVIQVNTALHHIHHAVFFSYFRIHFEFKKKRQCIQLFQKRLSQSKVDTRTERNCGGSNSTDNLLLLASTLHNIECRFIIMPRPYSNNFHWRVITHYDYTRGSFRFQYRLLTLTTFCKMAVNGLLAQFLSI